eukprot:2029495-Rhodomonas_salina.1
MRRGLNREERDQASPQRCCRSSSSYLHRWYHHTPDQYCPPQAATCAQYWALVRCDTRSVLASVTCYAPSTGLFGTMLRALSNGLDMMLRVGR